jgi:hypothetical protein
MLIISGLVRQGLVIKIIGAWRIVSTPDTDVYPSVLSFPESKVTVGENCSEHRREVQNRGRDAKCSSGF